MRTIQIERTQVPVSGVFEEHHDHIRLRDNLDPGFVSRHHPERADHLADFRGILFGVERFYAAGDLGGRSLIPAAGGKSGPVGNRLVNAGEVRRCLGRRGQHATKQDYGDSDFHHDHYCESANTCRASLSGEVGLVIPGWPIDVVIATYCLPSLPKKVTGTDSAPELNLVFHSILPVLESKARKWWSLVAPMNTSPPAVAMGPPVLRLPVFCFPAGSSSVMPSGTFH